MDILEICYICIHVIMFRRIYSHVADTFQSTFEYNYVVLTAGPTTKYRIDFREETNWYFCPVLILKVRTAIRSDMCCFTCVHIYWY